MDDEPSFAIDQQTLRQLLDHPEELHQVAEGMPIKRLLKITEAQLATLYKKALFLLEKKLYGEASSAFACLSFFDGAKSEFWLGLGMALQMQHHYDSAVDSYELAAACDPEEPTPYLYLGKCFFALHEYQTSYDAFEMALVYAEGNPRFISLVEQVRHALDLLKKQME